MKTAHYLVISAFLAAIGSVLVASHLHGLSLKETPLYHACGTGDYNAAASLLSSGADPNEADERGYSPLIAALASSRFDIAELLYANGANVNAKDNNGKSILHWQREMENEAAYRWLVSHGAKN